MSIHPEGKSSSDLVRVLVLNDPAGGRPHVQLYAGVLVVGIALYGLIIFTCGGTGRGL
jgi:hypothetical protein